MRRSLCYSLASIAAAPFLAALAQAAAPATPGAGNGWQDARTPSAGEARVIGSPANGCIGGAVALEPDGPGFQAIRLSRSRFWGHPETLDFIRSLGHRAAKAELGTVLIGDIGQARGGPMPWGHASHQTGLDVDVWLKLDMPAMPVEAREIPEPPSVIDPATKQVDPLLWSPAQAALIRLAAEDPRVARIFVAPGIKQALCESAQGDRSWLRVVRPWFGHEAHMHVRMRCPAGQAECVEQEPPPEGEGCGAELASWFAPPPPAPTVTTPKPAKTRPPMPAACAAVLETP